MAVMVILEMDGDTEALLAAAADLEARRPTSAVTARVVAPMDGGVIICAYIGSFLLAGAYLAISCMTPKWGGRSPSGSSALANMSEVRLPFHDRRKPGALASGSGGGRSKAMRVVPTD